MSEPDHAANTEALDAAIKKYMHENLGMDGLPTGWIVLVESARFDDEGETWYRFKYSCGPSLSLSAARGLMENCRDELAEQILRGQVGRQREDDD